MVMPDQKRPAELHDIGARVTFEWTGEKAFLIERWTVPIPEAPDGACADRVGRGMRHLLSSTTSTSARSRAPTR
jgi:hypothetical protein